MRNLINAPIKFVNTMQEALYFSTMSKILYVGEQQDIPNSFIKMPVLLPPIEAAYAEMNNDMQTYMYIYNNYLASSEIVDDILNQILVSLNNGVPIIVYIQDGDQLALGKVLPSFICDAVGLYNYETVQMIDVYGNPFFPYYNELYNPIIASRLYSYGNGLINAEELLALCPDQYIASLFNNSPLNNKIMNRLFVDFRINPTGMTQEQIYQKIINIKNKYIEFYINSTQGIDDNCEVSAFEYIGGES